MMTVHASARVDDEGTLPTTAELERLLAPDWSDRIMAASTTPMARLATLANALFGGRPKRVTRAMLKRFQGYSCQMPDGGTRTLHALAEIRVLSPVGTPVSRYRIVVDPASLTARGTALAGIVPACGGTTRLFQIEFVGPHAIAPLTLLHRDFSPVILDARGAMRTHTCQFAGPANTNDPEDSRPVRHPSGAGLRLVHSR